MTTGKTTALTKMDLCWQSNVSAISYAVQVGHNFPSKEQASFTFMAAVTICSDSGAPQNKVYHCCPIYLPWSDGIRCHDLVFWMLSFKPTFSLSSFTFITYSLFFFTFCSKGGVICISEVIDISPGNPDSSLCFLQPSVSHDVLCPTLLLSLTPFFETQLKSLLL